jgi:hypothetical protein
MDAIDEKDPLLVLLTEALRAGPGSPQWHEAIARVRGENTAANVDEYKLLLTAREHLESGKHYRSVRAGTGFTSRLMQRIDDDSGRRSRLPTATLIAIMAGLTIVAIVIAVGVWMTSDHPMPGGTEVVDRLLFVTPISSVNFERGDPATTNWRRIGSLALTKTGDLRPAPDNPSTKDFVGGAVISVAPVPAGQPASFEVTMRYGRHSPDVIAQVFITDQLDFSPDKSTSSNELVWQLQEGTARVILPGGRVEPKTLRIEPSRQTFTVRIAFNDKYATVDASDKRLYAGPLGLGDKDRYVGVRFLRKGNERVEIIAIQSMRLMKP